MTLAQIATWINQAIRFKLHPDQIVLIMDAAQKMAFDLNTQSFLVWTETLTPQFVLTFATGGYTNAVDADIGKTVVGASSGATGVLVSYDNTAKTWNITSSNDTEFEDDEAVSITTGTGAGTLDSEDSFEGFTGPYDAPTDPPCRKIWGVTTETDGRIFGTDETPPTPMNDFDFVPQIMNPAAFFKPGREDNVAKTFTFAQKPSVNGPTYRWVYWRDPPDIEDVEAESDPNLLIPSTYHMNFVNACIKLAQINLFGEDVDPQVIKAFFKPWHNTLARPYTPMGKGSNMTLNPRGSADSFL